MKGYINEGRRIYNEGEMEGKMNEGRRIEEGELEDFRGVWYGVRFHLIN